MKKIIIILLIILFSLCLCYSGLSYKKNLVPHSYYQVYLNDEKLGIIKSKNDLEEYIDKQSSTYKEKYKVNKVYAPNGLEVKKINTYSNKIDSIQSIYKKIAEKEDFTILGYQFKLKREDETKNIYVLDKKIFEQAIEQTIRTFVGETKYEAYKNKSQTEITTTGFIVENVYVDSNITVKETYIPVTETIYTDQSDLSKYMLFGTTEVQKTYTVKNGDTIENVAFNNKISGDELLISNPSFTSFNNLLFPGQEVVIGVIDPQIQVVVEEYSVGDLASRYKTSEKYDPDRIIGDDEIVQKGEDGLERVTQRTQIINGIIAYVDTIDKEELKPTIDEIVVRGEKSIPNVGSLKIWGWPTNTGWLISSGYAYRINPINGRRELHDGIDIAGTGYGSNVYAANNGTVVAATYDPRGGNNIIINHNNGYYTIYAHLSKILVKEGQTVSRGKVIGLVGSTGWSTGPHLHFGLFNGYPYRGGYSLNPWSVF